jgi:Rrf2 family iron-sulfur cluster assembly transcriptional regulator
LRIEIVQFSNLREQKPSLDCAVLLLPFHPVFCFRFRSVFTMRMSTKGRFAVNAMIDLALRESAGPVALASISARQQISLSYLEQMFSRLRKNGIVASTRGPGGGYTLGRQATDISVADIVSSVDEPLEEGVEGQASDDGMSRELWQRLNSVMLAHMGTISLKSLVDEQIAKGVTVEQKAPVRRAISAQPVLKPMRSTAPNSVFAFGRSFG